MAIMFSGLAVSAQIRVPRLVSDGMVLQREIPIRIWGFGAPGEKVTVKFDGETAGSVTDDNGKWVVELRPKKAGGPYVMDIDGINHIWIKNIMVGEVWACIGQYNMELPMGKVAAPSMKKRPSDASLTWRTSWAERARENPSNKKT